MPSSSTVVKCFTALMLGCLGCGRPYVDTAALPLLVTPEQLTELGNILLVDARPAEAYLARRITGAVSLDPALLAETRGGVQLMLRDPKALASVLSERGLARERAIVVYGAGDDVRAVGAATRVFWALKYMRYPRVSLLDGGFGRWLAEDGPTAEGEPSGTIRAARLAALPPESRLTVTAAEVGAALSAGGHVIIDGRREGYYSGRVPIRGDLRSGRIPGAVNIHYADLLQAPHMTFKPVPELEKLLYPEGVTRDSKIIIYCNAGYTSTVIWFAYLMLGHGEVANYDGSMLEWAADESRPVIVKDAP